jgi:hypothetical protein
MNERTQMIITKYDLLYESRMTRVETALENLSHDVREMKKDMKSDFRWIFGIIIGSNAGLFALMAHGFKWF